MLNNNQKSFEITYEEILQYFSNEEVLLIQDMYDYYKETSIERDGFYKNDNLSVYTALIETALSMSISTLKMYAYDNKFAKEKNILDNIKKYRSIIFKLSILSFNKEISIYDSINIKFDKFTSNEKLIYDLYKTSINYQFDDFITDNKYIDLVSDILFIIYLHISYAIAKNKGIDVEDTKKLINKIHY